MPSVLTLEGNGQRSSGKRCKRVSNGRTGCTIQLCYVGKSSKHPSGWKFMRGTSRCPTSGTRKRKRRRKK